MSTKAGQVQSQISHEEEITKNLAREFGLKSDNRAEFLEFVAHRADSVAIALRTNGISVTTTLWLIEKLPERKFHLDEFLRSVQVQYVNPGRLQGSRLEEGWLSSSDYRENLQLDKDSPVYKSYMEGWETLVQANQIVTRALIRNSVTLLAGTDANVEGAVPGFSMHDELSSLNRVGMSNANVLRAATSEAARFMKLKTGTIQVGYPAELVMLTGDPLASIENTRSIERVFFGKYHMDRDQINSALKAIATINDQARRDIRARR